MIRPAKGSSPLGKVAFEKRQKRLFRRFLKLPSRQARVAMPVLKSVSPKAAKTGKATKELDLNQKPDWRKV